MKRIILSGIAMFFMFPAFSQGPGEWKEKEAFHNVMSQTFHPMQEGNLEPIRQRAGELYDRAVDWQKSTPPAGTSHKMKLKRVLKKLVKESKELRDEIGEMKDEELKEELTELHDIFHKVVGICHHEGH